MLHPDKSGKAISAGVGGIAFSVSTLVAVTVINAPGGNYSASQVADYLTRGHRVPVIVAFHLALLGLFGLIVLLAHLRETIADVVGNRRAGSIVYGTGVAAAACFAIGWGVLGGQVVAHLEGGSAIAISPAVTYLLSEIGVVCIFGCGAILLGLALIALVLTSGTILPVWLRRLTVVCGLCGIAGLAFVTFFVLMLWGIAIGAWLIVAGRRTTSTAIAVGAEG
jgi:hypothetical protein